MASPKRRNPSRSTRRGSRRSRAHRRSPGVWLATLSTVVGVATGMFTLRDQVFPGEAGSAGAADESAYRADVGEICDEVNASEAARRRDDRRLAVRLRAAGNTLAQRDALLDAARRSAARSSHALAEFSALKPPAADAAAQRSTTRAWERSLDEVENYVERLDRAAGRPGLLAAVDQLSRERSSLAREGLRVNAGLTRLGKSRCVIDRPKVTRTITLPPDPQARRPARHTDRSRPLGRADVARPGAGRGHRRVRGGDRARAGVTPRAAPSPAPPGHGYQRPRPQPSSTPAPPSRPRVNTPSGNGPVAGGGEDG
jgi:hypothetical protein